MQEVIPGVFHWVTPHPEAHIPVSSYWVDAEGVAVDPLEPPDVGLEWFRERPRPPQAVLLTIGLHRRHAQRFVDAFGCSVHCHRAGLHRLDGSGLVVEPFDTGDLLPGGIVACDMSGLAPDDSALHLPSHRAVCIGDAIVRGGPNGPIGFVPDELMDDPQTDRSAILAHARALLDAVDFEHLLLAHGGPLPGNGRAQLEELVAIGGRTAFEF